MTEQAVSENQRRIGWQDVLWWLMVATTVVLLCLSIAAAIQFGLTCMEYPEIASCQGPR